MTPRLSVVLPRFCPVAASRRVASGSMTASAAPRPEATRREPSVRGPGCQSAVRAGLALDEARAHRAAGPRSRRRRRPVRGTDPGARGCPSRGRRTRSRRPRRTAARCCSGRASGGPEGRDAPRRGRPGSRSCGPGSVGVVEEVQGVVDGQAEPGTPGDEALVDLGRDADLRDLVEDLGRHRQQPDQVVPARGPSMTWRLRSSVKTSESKRGLVMTSVSRSSTLSRMPAPPPRSTGGGSPP